MGYGYSVALVRQVQARPRDGQKLGLKLARFCIAHDIPISRIAKRFGVSRQTVYNWFLGKCEPKKQLHQRITAFISE